MAGVGRHHWAPIREGPKDLQSSPRPLFSWPGQAQKGKVELLELEKLESMGAWLKMQGEGGGTEDAGLPWGEVGRGQEEGSV